MVRQKLNQKNRAGARGRDIKSQVFSKYIYTYRLPYVYLPDAVYIPTGCRTPVSRIMGIATVSSTRLEKKENLMTLLVTRGWGAPLVQ